MRETLNKAGITTSKEDNPVKQDSKQGESRDSKGRFQKGVSGNPNGRPPAGKTVVDQFRDNPQVSSVIAKLFKVADTLGTDNPDKDALSASKLIIERIIPSLKSSDLQIETTEKGYVVLPEPEEDDE